MSHLANNGSIVVVVLTQDKTATKYVANKNGNVEVLTCATATFKAKYPEVNTDAQATKDAATQMLNPPKGLKLTNAAIAALKPISTTLVSESKTMKPSKPSAPVAASTKPSKVAPAAPAKGTKVAATTTKVAVEKPAKEAKEPKAKGYAGRAYKVLVKENGTREGTWTHAMVQAILDNKTVDAANVQAKEHGDANGHSKTVDIGWAIAKGLIELV